MKVSVSDKLAAEGYNMHLEPTYPPLERLTWIYFRPDVFGIIEKESNLRIVFAECETNPSISKIKNKTFQIKQIVLQKFLGEIYELRLILAIPYGMFSKVNYSRIRRLWEIWMINKRGRIVYKVK
jgi:hypothetical protein